jgi:hypothetical protein
MQNKIFNKSIVLCFTLIIFFYQAQSKKINFLIMIDEKPSVLNNNLQLSSPSMEIIKANYIVGTIDFSENDYKKLFDDNSSYFNVTFETILPQHTFASNYSITIPKNFIKQKYIIINIFNMDNKIYKRRYSKLIKDNKEYYIVIETPSSMILN